jgi:hypothetical protein
MLERGYSNQVWTHASQRNHRREGEDHGEQYSKPPEQRPTGEKPMGRWCEQRSADEWKDCQPRSAHAQSNTQRSNFADPIREGTANMRTQCQPT